jgi:tRNA (Thr-GGU) A37 N-methylase
LALISFIEIGDINNELLNVLDNLKVAPIIDIKAFRGEMNKCPDDYE